MSVCATYKSKSVLQKKNARSEIIAGLTQRLFLKTAIILSRGGISELAPV